MRTLIADLHAITGPAHVLTEPDSVASYVTDWTRRYTGQATCVVRPGSTAEVAQVVRCCARYGTAVIPQGGNPGRVGGSVPQGEPNRLDQAPVIVPATRLTGLGDIEPAEAQVTAGA